MVGQNIRISRDAARRFLVQQFALDRFQSLPDVPTAIDRLEFVQEDSINICGRIHDLILWTRVRDYAPAGLHRTLYDHPRRAFEYYFPNLSALPIDDYPYFAPAMQARAQAVGRWHGLTDEEIPVAERLLLTIDAQGPLRTRATGAGDGYVLSGWGTRTTLAAHVVEKLWLHGRLTVSHRENFERWFDRTERLLPHVATLTFPDAEEIERFKIRKRLRARRLFRLKSADRAALGHDAFTPVEIEGVAGRAWHILAEDADTLRAIAASMAVSGAPDAPANDEAVVHFLAPLDPLIYDRDRNRALWDFDYIWEVLYAYRQTPVGLLCPPYPPGRSSGRTDRSQIRPQNRDASHRLADLRARSR